MLYSTMEKEPNPSGLNNSVKLIGEARTLFNDDEAHRDRTLTSPLTVTVPSL